jgi:hypothetical protein
LATGWPRRLAIVSNHNTFVPESADAIALVAPRVAPASPLHPTSALTPTAAPKAPATPRIS